jgi:hypothetical protein
MLMTRKKLLGRDPRGLQYVLARGMCDLRHKAHCAGTYHDLYVKAVCRHYGQPAQCSHLPYPLSIKETALAALLAKPAPAQRHAHHCIVFEAARHTHTHTRARTHIRALTLAHTHTYTRAHARTHTHARAHTRTKSHRHTRTHTHA